MKKFLFLILFLLTITSVVEGAQFNAYPNDTVVNSTDEFIFWDGTVKNITGTALRAQIDTTLDLSGAETITGNWVNTANPWADNEVADDITVNSSSAVTTAIGFDGIGAVGLDYGSIDITDHTFITDGTGDSEIVLPNDSIGAAEILDDSLDFLHLSDTLTLDATTTVDMDTNTSDLNFDSNTLFIDQSTNRVGVGTSTPGTALDVNGELSATNVSFSGSMQIPNSATPTTDATAEIALDTTITDHQPLLQYYDGGENMTVIAIDTSELPALDNEIIKYDAATDKFVLEADATGAGSGAFDDSSDPVVMNTTTKDVVIGTSAVNTSKLTIDGDADQVQLSVQGNGTQTDSVIIVETSAGTETLNIESDGTILTAVGIDAIGAVDMDYGSADVTDHTFTTDGTGDAEIVLPTGSIGSTEILDATIVTGDIAADTITHANIADADQADTKCFTFYESDGIDADDDLESVWANKTANDFLLTEIWCETDTGTVTAMLQVDDGTPADVDTVDLACVSTEVEDTSLNGDTTVAAGEELDWAVTSTATTPLFVRVCFTGNWVD